jgi:hypothetical protein
MLWSRAALRRKSCLAKVPGTESKLPLRVRILYSSLRQPLAGPLVLGRPFSFGAAAAFAACRIDMQESYYSYHPAFAPPYAPDVDAVEANPHSWQH